MSLTIKQEEGLRIAVQRYKNGEKYTLIQGYAGTGKSFLVRTIIEALGVEEEKVAYATFTGKAADVLLKKGNSNAMTLHKLLYSAIPNEDGTFTYVPKMQEEMKYEIVVVDEASMAPKSMMDLLFSFPLYVLILGDPFQLSPIHKDEGSVFFEKPHIFLDEVMRQAKDSEIVRLSMEIRAGMPLRHFIGKDVQVLNSNELNTGMLTWADMILCATNKTRTNINQEVRKLKGFSDGPQVGDKVICTTNYWKKTSREQGDPLINGMVGYIKSLEEKPYWIHKSKWSGPKSIWVPAFNGVITTDNDDYYSLTKIDKTLLTTGKPRLTMEQEGKLRTNGNSKNPFGYGYLIPLTFEYGYCCTVHKAQGSQWDKILVLEENFPWDKEEHARHLYTALTRAVEKCVIIKR